MIHLGFREVGARTGSMQDLSKIAQALKEGNSTNVMVYFEFASADELLLFCRAVELAPKLGDLEELEMQKLRLQKEVDDLTEARTEASSRVHLDVAY